MRPFSEDVVELPTPGLIARRSRPEGNAITSTKGRHSRRVPVAERVLPIITAAAAGTAAGDLLLTATTGSQLRRTAVLRTVGWATTGQGRRIHETRPCLLRFRRSARVSRWWRC